jgi:class 3 adenylate cyclase/tetratricopeptide (TPR) repeat protein
MKFCGHCGSPLRAAPAETAELRQLTVLFCDLAGSTALSESLQPEDLREVVGTYQSVCENAIGKHEGHIAQYLGDGVLVYFGYPVAHEDDDRRAVRTALEIVSDLEQLSARLRKTRGISLNARLGIHTGPVVVGDVGGGERREQLAVGMTPNVAARIQSIAAPGTVLISEDTHAIVRGFFDFTPLGAHEIKGLAKSVTLYRAVRESGAESRLDAERRIGLTPLRGRDRELGLFNGLWNRLTDTGGRTVLIQGEAGIGKSRIADAFREHAKRSSGTVLESFCTPYAQSTPLFPIIGMMERVLGFARDTADSEKRAAIEQRLARRGVLTRETLALMTGLLSLPPDGDDPLVNYSPQRRRERTLETLQAWLLAVTGDRPTLWLVEDLHWADSTSLEFVGSVIRASSSSPLLLILTFRPNFTPPWNTNDRVLSMNLSRLSPGDTESMAVSVANGKAMPPEVLSGIIARAEGVPLFVEEITKAVLEMGVLVEREDRFEISGPFPPGLIPTTVQGSLHSRLDRLGAAKGVAQVAATIGREFTFALLRAVARDSEAELSLGLDRLIGAGLLSRQEELPEETYLFKHALIRDAAYQSLLRKSRRDLHRRIAEALTSHFPDTVRQNPELVAEHFTAADCAEDAVKWWLHAGRQAVARAANHEAMNHLQRGLELAGSLPPEERHRQELELLIALMPAIIAAETWASPRLELIYRRAAALVDVIGDTPHRFTVLAGTMLYHWVGCRLTDALRLAKELLELAIRIGEPSLVLVGRQGCCGVHCYRGEHLPSVEHGSAGLALYSPDLERVLSRNLGLSPCVGITGYTSLAHWMLGFPERAWRTAERGIEVAGEVGHPPSLGFALTNKVRALYAQSDADGLLATCDAALRVVQEERLGFYEPHITIYRAWALAEHGQTREAAEQIRDALARYYASGNGAQQVSFHDILAGVLWKAGEWDDAFSALETGMRLARECAEGVYEPELYRRKGEFLAAEAMGTAGRPAAIAAGDRAARLAAAEQCVRESLGLARAQMALTLELRSLVSLCRIRREADSVSTERDELAAVYARFTEGFDTPDLREAREILEAPVPAKQPRDQNANRSARLT